MARAPLPPRDPVLPRDQFPITRRWSYLNSATQGATPQPVLDAMHAAALEAAEDSALSFDPQVERLDEIRSTAAALMGVHAADVAFVKNTTEGMSLVAAGLDLGPGDRVVVPGAEFPSAALPFLGLRDRGVQVDLVPVDEPTGAVRVDAFAEVIARGPAPAALVVSWVQYARGWRTDLVALAALAHEVGAVLVVDAIQGLGVHPAAFAAWGVDAACADGHKWLLGPNGAGLLYVAPALRDRLRVLQPGWRSGPDEEISALRPHWHPDARRFEGGSPNFIGLYGLGAGLDMLMQAGLPQVWAYVDDLCGMLAAGLAVAGATVLSDRSAQARSSIVSCTVPGVPADEVVRALLDERIVVNVRDGAVRIAPHAFNSRSEIDHLVDRVRSL